MDALTVRAAGDAGQGATVARRWTIHCAFTGVCGDSLRAAGGGAADRRLNGPQRGKPPVSVRMPGAAPPAAAGPDPGRGRADRSSDEDRLRRSVLPGGRSRRTSPTVSRTSPRSQRCPASASWRGCQAISMVIGGSFSGTGRVRSPIRRTIGAAARALARPTTSLSWTIISEAAKVGTVAITLRRSPSSASAASTGPVSLDHFSAHPRFGWCPRGAACGDRRDVRLCPGGTVAGGRDEPRHTQNRRERAAPLPRPAAVDRRHLRTGLRRAADPGPVHSATAAAARAPSSPGWARSARARCCVPWHRRCRS